MWPPMTFYEDFPHNNLILYIFAEGSLFLYLQVLELSHEICAKTWFFDFYPVPLRSKLYSSKTSFFQYLGTIHYPIKAGQILITRLHTGIYSAIVLKRKIQIVGSKLTIIIFVLFFLYARYNIFLINTITFCEGNWNWNWN